MAWEQQIKDSTEDELRDRLAALRERYDNQNLPEIYRGYRLPQLAELHHIVAELELRQRQHRFTDKTRVVYGDGTERDPAAVHNLISTRRHASC